MDFQIPGQDKIGRFVITYELTRGSSHSSNEHGRGDYDLEVQSVTAISKGSGGSLDQAQTLKLLRERRDVLLERARAETAQESLPGAEKRKWKNHGLLRKEKRGDLEFHSEGREKHSPVIVYAEYEEGVEWIVKGLGDTTPKFKVTVLGDPVMDNHAFSSADSHYEDITAPAYHHLFEPWEATSEGGSAILGPALYEAGVFSFYKYHIMLLESPWTSVDPCIVCGTPR